MALSNSKYRLYLQGAFCLLDAEGRRIEVGSKKGVALIAMLALAKNGERTRGWLQDKLWGKREKMQAQNSLRRELSNLRKHLNRPSTELILCERDRVRLDLDRVDVDVLDANSVDDVGSGTELLEGLDIAGEDGFEDWLREQRNRRAERIAERPRSATAGVSTSVQSVRTLPPQIVDLSQPAPGFGGRPALAVLSFENFTGDPSNDYLAEGISEELIERLSRLRWLPIIGRSSSFSFAARHGDHRIIGRELGAKYLLEGRVRQGSSEYQISASLLEAESGYVVCSPRLTLPSPYAPGAIEQLVIELAAVLGTRIDHAEQVFAHAKPQGSLSLNELIWRGRWHLNRFTREDSEIARELFDKALAIDPGSSDALIHATWCRLWSLWAERGSEPEILEMRKLAHRAIVADHDDCRGHLLAGIAETWLRRHKRARVLIERAITLNPSLPMAHFQLGDCLYLAGEPEKAIAPFKTALRLSPNDMHLFFTLGEMAVSYCMMGQWDEAIEHAEQSVVRRPAYWFAHMVKINALVRRGDIDDARIAYLELKRAKPRFEPTYINWVPFVDPQWNAFFIEGVVAVCSDAPPIEVLHTRRSV